MPVMIRRGAALWLLPCLVTSTLLAAEPAAPLPAESLALRSVDGSAIPFADLVGPDGRAVCFAFLHPTCPLAQEYGPVLRQLAAEFADDRIRFVGVICECDDPREVAAYGREFGIPFPIHLDTDFSLAQALDATVTPEVVLVDRDRRILYAGRIDDRYKVRGVMSPGEPLASPQDVFHAERAQRPINGAPSAASRRRTAASLPVRISATACSGWITRGASPLSAASRGTIVAAAITSGRKIRVNRGSSRLSSPRRR